MSLKLAILDVGHGMSTVLFEPRGRAVVFDVPAGTVTTEFLLDQEVCAVVEVIISHFHKDHCGSLDLLMAESFPIPTHRVWIGDCARSNVLHIERIQAMFTARRAAGFPIERGHPHSDLGPIKFGEFDLEFVGPLHEDGLTRPNDNGTSTIVRVLRGESGMVLLPGDMTIAEFDRIVSTRPDGFSADWLMFPHHGGSLGTAKGQREAAFRILEAVQPKNVVLSYARSDGEQMPRSDIVSALQARYPDVTFVCTQLSMQCSKALRPEVDSFHHPISAGRRQGGACCTGSMVLDISDEISWDQRSAHEQFMSANAPIRLCASESGKTVDQPTDRQKPTLTT